MDAYLLDAMIGGMFGMNLNCYFGVRSLETIVEGIKNMDSKAQIALFAGAGLAAYGYFKYGRRKKDDGNKKKAHDAQ